MEFKELKADEVTALDADAQVKYFNDLNAFRAKKLEDLEKNLKANASDEIAKQITALKDTINAENKEQLTAMFKALEKQGLAITKLMTDGGSEKKVETLKDQIEAVKEGISAAVNKQVKEYEFVVKANALTTSITNSTQALRLQDIGQLGHKRLTARDVFGIIPVGADSKGVVRYSDWDAASTVRAAAMVAEGAAFPESEAVWEEFTLELKKIGDTIPVSEELVYDASRFAAELNSFIETNIAIVENLQLTAGSGLTTNLNGVYTTAPTFTAVASGISDASIYDLIVVMKAAITGPYGSKYMPDFAFMNIADINKMKLKKDANENYILPPFVDRNGQQVDGLVVVENNDITADTFVMGDSRYGKIYEIEGVSVSVGYTGDQFAEDLMTLKGRRRENLLIRNVDKTGFLKSTGIAADLVTLAT